MNLNKVILVGRLAADPETRTIPSGQNVTTIRLATSRVWYDQSSQKQEQTEFHTIVCWGKLSDITSRYLRKGQLAMFEGRLQTRSWDGQDGVKRYKTEVVAEGMQMGPKAMGGSGSNYNNDNQSQNNYNPRQNRNNNTNSKSNDDDDIPVINEEEPFDSTNNKNDDDGVEEKQIDLKDIPF
ncbi:MAG: single-stranded DNA-binding protein [Candidatus Yanofskybacteria bacterium CG10_big_fil_rev_8_21_14_0_10_36_16]|uniref:Single-stranded DNA-binding protein n=1 Tax=Candidatus Yanofskybacteria bacterium CG10_big_fil_rev_8_21_14_0_10_36_16 TaxID=1975096 RepID=A0A2J0Q8E8_9BACT|nr:MAG: single-stranded DNA-binding protein [Candidatus Yanofskybacteria bacterium CG10_big_fil_rev_8_21_14_0_10_36_16]